MLNKIALPFPRREWSGRINIFLHFHSAALSGFSKLGSFSGIPARGFQSWEGWGGGVVPVSCVAFTTLASGAKLFSLSQTALIKDDKVQNVLSQKIK